MLVKKMQTQVQELDGKEVAIQGWCVPTVPARILVLL